LVECCQGPCKANQEYLAGLRKPVDVCKNIFCTRFKHVAGDEHNPNPEGEALCGAIYSKASQLIASMLESRGSDHRCAHTHVKKGPHTYVNNAKGATVRIKEAL